MLVWLVARLSAAMVGRWVAAAVACQRENFGCCVSSKLGLETRICCARCCRRFMLLSSFYVVVVVIIFVGVVAPREIGLLHVLSR